MFELPIFLFVCLAPFSSPDLPLCFCSWLCPLAPPPPPQLTLDAALSLVSHFGRSALSRTRQKPPSAWFYTNKSLWVVKLCDGDRRGKCFAPIRLVELTTPPPLPNATPVPWNCTCRVAESTDSSTSTKNYSELPTVKIDNQRDAFATIVSVSFGDKLGDLIDTVRVCFHFPLVLFLRRLKPLSILSALQVRSWVADQLSPISQFYDCHVDYACPVPGPSPSIFHSR